MNMRALAGHQLHRSRDNDLGVGIVVQANTHLECGGRSAWQSFGLRHDHVAIPLAASKDGYVQFHLAGFLRWCQPWGFDPLPCGNAIFRLLGHIVRRGLQKISRRGHQFNRLNSRRRVALVLELESEGEVSLDARARCGDCNDGRSALLFGPIVFDVLTHERSGRDNQGDYRDRDRHIVLGFHLRAPALTLFDQRPLTHQMHESQRVARRGCAHAHFDWQLSNSQQEAS